MFARLTACDQKGHLSGDDMRLNMTWPMESFDAVIPTVLIYAMENSGLFLTSANRR